MLDTPFRRSALSRPCVVFDLNEGHFDLVFVHLGSLISAPTTMIGIARPAVLTRNASSRHSVAPPNDPLLPSAGAFRVYRGADELLDAIDELGI